MYKMLVNVNLSTLRMVLNVHFVRINLISVSYAQMWIIVLNVMMMDISIPFLIQRMIIVFVLKNGSLIRTKFVKTVKWLSMDVEFVIMLIHALNATMSTTFNPMEKGNVNALKDIGSTPLTSFVNHVQQVLQVVPYANKTVNVYRVLNKNETQTINVNVNLILMKMKIYFAKIVILTDNVYNVLVINFLPVINVTLHRIELKNQRKEFVCAEKVLYKMMKLICVLDVLLQVAKIAIELINAKNV